MEILTFKDRQAYRRIQLRTTRKHGNACYFCSEEIARIAEWMRRNGLSLPVWGICHGARFGWECDEFHFQFPTARVFGTDLLPKPPKKLKKAKCKAISQVIKWDFMQPHVGWVGKFDFVYSNSLDHSSKPRETLKVWLSQLTDNGRLFVQWTPSHTTTHTGDCFGATLWEYVELLHSVGRVEDLILTNAERKQNVLQRRGLVSVVIVARPK